MPAFRITTKNWNPKPNEEGWITHEYFFDHGGHAYNDLQYMLSLAAESMPSKHHAHKLLNLIEKRGDLNPACEYYNQWSPNSKFYIEQINFIDRDLYAHNTPDLIEEVRARIVQGTEYRRPINITISRGPTPEELRKMQEDVNYMVY